MGQYSRTLLPTFPCKTFSRRCSGLLTRRKYHSWRCLTAVRSKSCCAEGRSGGHRDCDLKGYIPGLREPVWNLNLGCICDLIQNIFWHHVHSLPRVSSPPIPAQCEFPSTTANWSHVSPLLLSSVLLSFSLCCLPPSHSGSLNPRAFLGGITLCWEWHSIHIFKYSSCFQYCFLMKSCKTLFLKTLDVNLTLASAALTIRAHFFHWDLPGFQNS